MNAPFDPAVEWYLKSKYGIIALKTVPLVLNA